MWRVCLLVLAACSFEHGELAGGDDTTGPCMTSAPPWWDPAFVARFPVSISAPANYTLTVDASGALAVGADVRVVVHATTATEIDRVLDGSNLTFKVPAAGSVWIYAGPGPARPMANAANVYLFAEDFEAIALASNGDARFIPDPPNEWTVTDDAGNHVLHAAGIARHAAAVRALMPTDVELAARIRFGTGGGQNHVGLVARSNSMAVTTMDGLVAQLQQDIQHARIGEYLDGASPPTELAGVSYTITRGVWYALRFRLVGTTLEFYVAGQRVTTATAPASDGSLLGLFAHNCDVDYDDVRIKLAMTPEPIATVGGIQRCN